MSWAQHYIDKLKKEETVTFRPRGRSMEPRIKSGALVTVAPVGEHVLKSGDIVLCAVGTKQYLHFIKKVTYAPTVAWPNVEETLYTIGNNRGGINGDIKRHAIYGVLTDVAP